MRYLPLLLLLSFIGLVLPACAQKATPPKTNKAKKISHKAAAAQVPAKPAKEVSPAITFERTPCFGTCPGYVMKVYADGRVDYEGRRAVPLMGARTLKLPPAAVADLLRQAQEAHFDQFNDKYLSGATDLPSTILAIRQPNGALKTVVIESNAPENVRQLFTAFGNQFDALAQLTVTSDK